MGGTRRDKCLKCGKLFTHWGTIPVTLCRECRKIKPARKSIIFSDLTAWAVVDKHGKIVVWHSADGERGLEIHCSRAEARAACFSQDGERVVKVRVERV